jgi:hypothetical protein
MHRFLTVSDCETTGTICCCMVRFWCISCENVSTETSDHVSLDIISPSPSGPSPVRGTRSTRSAIIRGLREGFQDDKLEGLNSSKQPSGQTQLTFLHLISKAQNSATYCRANGSSYDGNRLPMKVIKPASIVLYSVAGKIRAKPPYAPKCFHLSILRKDQTLNKRVCWP